MFGRLVLFAALLLGLVSGPLASSPPPSDEAGGCAGSTGKPAAAGPSAALSNGSGLAAVHGRRLLVLSETGARREFRPSGPPGIPRHAASRPGLGTAHVTDTAGPDVLVVMTPTGMTTISGRGDLSHPAWSPKGDLAWSVDLSMLELWSPESGRRRAVRPPRSASAVFSPVFTGSDRLVAIVGEPVRDIHDDALNNLWRYDIGRGSWRRLTRFGADADRWSVLRTPVVAPDGSLLFVRVRGRAGATEAPSFELWRLRGRRAMKVRDLPGEMYLAGFLRERTVWNVPDAATGDWRLVADAPGGPADLGCGAVAVDPVGRPDPDLLEPMTEDPGAEDPGSEAVSAEPGKGLAVAIGDFASEMDARTLQESLGIAGSLVIDHQAAPAAVRPGAWAVAVPIPGATLPEEALERFRARHPDLAGLTWIVPWAPREVAA